MLCTGIAFMIAFLAAGCASMPGYERLAIRVSQGKPFVIYTNDKSLGWGQNAFPQIRQYRDDLIVVFYYTEGDQMAGPYVTVDEAGEYLPGHSSGKGPTYSADGGKTWITARPALFSGQNVAMSPEYAKKSPFDAPEYFYSFTEDNEYQYAFAPLVYPHESGDGYNAIGSMIKGKRGGYFEPPIDVLFHVVGPDNSPIFYALYLGPRGVVLPNGEILLVGYSAWPEIKTRHGHGRSCVALVSTNGGRSFHTRSVIATPADSPWGNEGPNEPAIEIMPNGDLVCVMRTGIASGLSTDGRSIAAPMLLSRSQDGGYTWTHTKMLYNGVMPKLLRMSNGLVALAFGRPGNNLVFSTDNGYHWGHEVAISRADVLTSGYIDIIELAPGKLLAVYDVFDTPLETFWLWEPHRINGIVGKFLHVERRLK
jgi:hypothetical protein